MLFMGACAGQKTVVDTPKAQQTPYSSSSLVSLGDVFFDFDKSELRSDARDQLQTNYRWLGENQSRKLTIEGHCDERGTNEYNLALGERRAKTARDYIVNLGAIASRINTVSYGEERPFTNAHTEEAWSQNRRAHFVAE